MYKEPFGDIEDLKRHVEEDKQANGVGAATLDRYPIRFVLFDNFRDCFDFVEYLQSERGAHVESVDRWIDTNYPDLMITHVELAERIEEHIKKKSPHDCVIAPFSELARFYENDKKKSFDALLKTIKAIQASGEGVENHQRVYIPLVGLEGKMEAFKDDTQINIWRLVSKEKDLTYKLILTSGQDFGVKGLETNYTIVNNIREWLNIWKDSQQQVSPQIICKSRAIYANAVYAQPDNAFIYKTCCNAYEFLTDGLELNLGGIQPLMSDGDNWERLAEEIDVSTGFSFTKFVKQHFGIDNIETYKDFIRLWFSHSAIFDRWLLARYYDNKEDGQGYLCRVLKATTNYGTNELFETMAKDISEITAEMEIRRYCLKYAAQKNVLLTESAESMVARTLQALPARMGYTSALRYFTGITRKEKEIALQWLGQGKIMADDVKRFFPDLYCYVAEGIGVSAGVPDWVNGYIEKYKRAKLANRYTEEISQIIQQLNETESKFDLWYNSFSPVYTLLKNRGDIEVFYWIDGLGIDWIPLVKQIVAEYKEQQIFLNEIKIARAKLPTTTNINKAELQRLLPEGQVLEKFGDLDALAHRTNNISPFTVIKEIELIRKSIENILQLYVGKKIAIVSDHGLTYLSQMVKGKNFAGVVSDHYGRIVIREKAGNDADNSYFRLEDGKTLCALKHESLCAKVPANQGAHGGCTPEEVLVPIFIISSAPAPTNWLAQLLTYEISGSNPKAQIEIKNLPSTDVPYVNYNGKAYQLHHLGGDVYETDDLILDVNCQDMSLHVGDVERPMKIKVSTGVQENDLFGS